MTVSQLRTEMIERFDAVDKRFDAIDKQFADLRAELRGYIDVLYEKFRDDVRLIGEGRPSKPPRKKPH